MDSYDFPMAFRGVTFNGHRTAAGILDPTKEADTARVNAFDFSRLQQRDQREALHLLTGGDLGDASLAFRYLSIAGTLKAPDGATLDDRIAAIEAAFDVEEAQRSSPSTDGITPFTFTGVTKISTGRGTAYSDVHGVAGEFLVERFFARPAAYAIITGRRSGGDTAGFAAELVCEDPRRYIDTAEAIAANVGNGYNVALPNWSAATGKAVKPVLTIVMAGAGSATLTITLNGLALILKMDLETAGTFTVDCATGIIKKGAVHRADLRVSGVTTPFLEIPPAGSAIVVTNTANVTSVTAGYRQARG